MKHVALTLVLLLGFTASVSGAPAESRLLVYLDVPASVRTDVRLELAGLTLTGSGISIDLPLTDTVLSATELAGTRHLLTEARIPRGHFSRLHLAVPEVRGRVGVAPVRLAAPDSGLVVDLDLDVPGGDCAVLFLTWDPHPITETMTVYDARLGRHVPPAVPRGSLAFVTCRANGILLALDRTTWKPVDALFLGDEPGNLAFSEYRQQLYIPVAGSDEIVVVDALSLQVLRRVALGFGDRPSRLIVTRDQETLLVLNAGSRTLVGLSLLSFQESLRIPLGETPRDLAEDPLTRQVYVTDEHEGRIVVYDLVNGQEVGAISQVIAPVEIEIAPLGRQVFASSAFQHRIFHLDLDSGEGGESLSFCGRAVGLAWNGRSNQLYAALDGCNEIGVLSPALDLEFASIPLEHSASWLAFDREERQLFAVLPDVDALAVCSVSQGTVVKIVPTCGQPFAVISP